MTSQWTRTSDGEYSRPSRNTGETYTIRRGGPAFWKAYVNDTAIGALATLADAQDACDRDEASALAK